MTHILTAIKNFFAVSDFEMCSPNPRAVFQNSESIMSGLDSGNLPSFITDGDRCFPEETDNGLYFNGEYVPEEVLTIILSHLPDDQVLRCTLVCRKWNRIIKSYPLWSTKYVRKYNRKPKHLPWYLLYSLMTSNYFDVNLLKNGCGQEQFKYWTINANGGDKFKVEKEPLGSDPLPLDVPEFNGCKSCFVTSYYTCSKEQLIPLDDNKLFHFILNNFKPHIYVSEWITGRFDCACYYKLTCRLVAEDYEELVTENVIQHSIQQWEGKTWEKKEMIIQDYPTGVCGIVYKHKGRDTQFWKGHYGTKMAGGVVKILFDSINVTT